MFFVYYPGQDQKPQGNGAGANNKDEEHTTRRLFHSNEDTQGNTPLVDGEATITRLMKMQRTVNLKLA